jgi:proteic killer suppression protein
MIASFIHKGLAELFASGRTAKINKSFHTRLIARLDALDVASVPCDMNVPGWNFHQLKGFTPTRYSVHVNGPWCLTFEFTGTDAARLNFEDYH